MTDYINRGLYAWTGGGECPIHRKSLIDVFHHDATRDEGIQAGLADWNDSFLFRVLRLYVDPDGDKG